jgi:hypothetical protein
MPDVFISYSKADKHHAEMLADDLKAVDLAVWWDAELYASQDYHNVILEALNTCRVAIAIWSENAIKSKWVRDEAERAQEDGKLLPTYIPPFTKKNIPLGMGQTQVVDLTDRPEIVRTLNKLGLNPRTAQRVISFGVGDHVGSDEEWRKDAPEGFALLQEVRAILGLSRLTMGDLLAARKLQLQLVNLFPVEDDIPPLDIDVREYQQTKLFDKPESLKRWEAKVMRRLKNMAYCEYAERIGRVLVSDYKWRHFPPDELDAYYAKKEKSRNT